MHVCVIVYLDRFLFVCLSASLLLYCLVSSCSGIQVEEVNAIEPGLMQDAERFFVLTQTDNLWKEHLQAIKFLQQVGTTGCLHAQCTCCLSIHFRLHIGHAAYSRMLHLSRFFGVNIPFTPLLWCTFHLCHFFGVTIPFMPLVAYPLQSALHGKLVYLGIASWTVA